jgi:hypothetical protein
MCELLHNFHRLSVGLFFSNSFLLEFGALAADLVRAVHELGAGLPDDPQALLQAGLKNSTGKPFLYIFE